MEPGVTGTRKGRGIAGMGLASPGCNGMVISGVTRTTSSVSLLFIDLDLNRFPRIGKLDKTGNLGDGFGHLVVDETGNDKALAFAQLDIGLHFARRQRREW